MLVIAEVHKPHRYEELLIHHHHHSLENCKAPSSTTNIHLSLQEGGLQVSSSSVHPSFVFKVLVSSTIWNLLWYLEEKWRATAIAYILYSYDQQLKRSSLLPGTNVLLNSLYLLEEHYYPKWHNFIFIHCMSYIMHC